MIIRMKYILFLFCFGSLISVLGQSVDEPILLPNTHRIYLSITGNDGASGDSLNPLSTFSQALSKLEQLTATQSGAIHAEVVLFPGQYTQALTQAVSQYQLTNRTLHVSVRGIGLVELDGSMLSNLSPGGGMIHLLGSHISVKNISVIFSPVNGVRFGYDWNGTVIPSHDIWIEHVNVSSTLGHGILVGIGALNSNNPLNLSPMTERFMITGCLVQDAVNFNIPQNDWGSAIKAWNAKHVTIKNCWAQNNSGEGIDLDYCDSVEITDNQLNDNYANIYLDKAQHVWIHRNFIRNEQKQMPGILIGLEAFTGLLTNHYNSSIKIYNNVLLNTQGIHFWQGNYSGIQHGYFQQIDITHNTIIGRQSGAGSCIHFNYDTFLGNPVLNVHFDSIRIERNSISAHIDSLNNGKLCHSSLFPQPGLTGSYNLLNQATVNWSLSPTDSVHSGLPIFGNTPYDVIPGSNALDLLYSVPLSWVTTDYYGQPRTETSNNCGAIVASFTELAEITTERLELFPNPCTSQLFVEGISGEKAELFDYSGTFIGTLSRDMHLSFDVSSIPSGSYLIVVEGKIGTFIKR